MNAFQPPVQTKPVAHAGLAVVWLLACLTVGVRSLAQETATIAEDVATVQPFVSETTWLVVKVDPQRLALPDQADVITSMVPNLADHYQQWAAAASATLDPLRSATGGEPLYASLGIPISSTNWPAFAFVRETPRVDAQALLDIAGQTHRGQPLRHAGYLVIAPSAETDVSAVLAQASPVPRPDLEPALEAVSGFPIQCVLLPPDYVRATIADLLPELPALLGGGPSSVLTQGVQWAALGVDPAQLRAQLIIESASPQAAQQLAERLPELVRSLYATLPERRRPIPAEAVGMLISLLQPQLAESRVTIPLDGLQQMAPTAQLMSQFVAAFQQSRARQTNSNHFKQILIALHNHHDSYRMFPPRDEVRNAEGKSGLSWRVHILPFVDEMELYQQFQLDEPWDSPRNKSLLEKMPAVYQRHTPAMPAGHGVPPGHTTFLAPVGANTVFGGAKATKFGHILDGTSNTVVLVEVKPELAVPWTAPDDYVFDPANPGTGMLSSDGRVLVGLADGSVQSLPADLPAEVFLRLFQMKDGEMVDWESLR